MELLLANELTPPPHRYYSHTEAYLKAVALRRMPPNLQTVDMIRAGEC